MKITLAGSVYSAEDIARRVGGSVMRAPDAADEIAVRHICTDSREADKDTLFVALPGERVDGHRFLPVAAGLGARVFLCARGRCPEALPSGCVAILVEDTTHHKPHPEPILKCLERMGLSPEEVIYIGDAPTDLLAAQNAGVDFGFAQWGSIQASDMSQSLYCFEKPEDVLRLIAE